MREKLKPIGVKYNTISWQYLYELEHLLNVSIGAKERFIVLSRHAKQLFPQTDSLKILDGGGCNFTSFLMKKIFPNSFIVSVNIDGKNDAADLSIVADLADHEKIVQSSGISKFDLIFLGEVFEHLVRPYLTLKDLMKLLKHDGHAIITTPNLANIYNRILLLLGRPLSNYRPLGVLPCDDHISVVTKQQMLNLLQKELKLEVVATYGFSYYEQKIGLEPKNDSAKSGRKLRLVRAIANKILPTNFKEGIIYITKPF